MTFKKGKRWFADWCDETGKRKRKAFFEEAEASAYQAQQQQIARREKSRTEH